MRRSRVAPGQAVSLFEGPAMSDGELRLALLRFFEDQNALSQRFQDALLGVLEQVGPDTPIYDALEGQVKYLGSLQRAGERLLQLLGNGRYVDIERVAVSKSQVSSPELSAFQREFVALYNAEPAKWARTFRPIDFGAENVNEIWEKGGEPRFAKKEGGIYNLVDANGTFFVVPEPGLRLQQSYFRSEGLRYLFEVALAAEETEPLVCLIRPAMVEESGGRWTILNKGELRGRS